MKKGSAIKDVSDINSEARRMGENEKGFTPGPEAHSPAPSLYSHAPEPCVSSPLPGRA